ncbi:hypothetical protein STEG23_029185 [Scotinomys teguina]
MFCGFYIFTSWQSGLFSSCCLALDSSSSFPCPAFRAIAKSPEKLRVLRLYGSLLGIVDLSLKSYVSQEQREAYHMEWYDNSSHTFSETSSDIVEFQLINL